jgi:hypothetical protein
MRNEEIEYLYKRAGLSKGLPVTREDLVLRLEKAVADGKLDPRVLGAFLTQPLNILATISEEIAKSYGIPRPVQREVPRMPAFSAPWWEQLAYRNATTR